VCSRDESSDVEEFDGDRPTAGNAGAIVGFTSIAEVETLTGAFDLEVANCALGIDGREPENLDQKMFACV
jgi:hypothetical protein